MPFSIAPPKGHVCLLLRILLVFVELLKSLLFGYSGQGGESNHI
jgi:hypothetical protein